MFGVIKMENEPNGDWVEETLMCWNMIIEKYEAWLLGFGNWSWLWKYSPHISEQVGPIVMGAKYLIIVIGRSEVGCGDLCIYREYTVSSWESISLPSWMCKLSMPVSFLRSIMYVFLFHSYKSLVRVYNCLNRRSIGGMEPVYCPS